MRPVSSLNERPPLVVKTLEALQPMVDRSSNDRNALRNPKSPQEAYALGVFDRGLALVEAVDTLRQVIFYIRQYPSAHTYRTNGPDKADWLRYHIENYHVRLSGLKDRAVNLVAEVYGIRPKKKQDRPGYRQVVDSDWISASIRMLLEDIGKLVSESKDVRDGVVHEFSYNDEELHRVKAARFLPQDEDSELQRVAYYFRMTTRFYVRETAQKLERISEKLEATCMELLTELEWIYVSFLPDVTWRSELPGTTEG